MKTTTVLQGLGFATLTSLLLPACGPSAAYSTALQPGAVESKPDGTYFIVDPNNSGESTTMSLTSVTYGRLIDEVYDITGAAVLHRNLVIDMDIVSNTDYLIETNPVSQFTTLTILHTQGTAAYESAFDQLFTGMEPILEKGLETTVLPPFTMIPRNAAMVVQFSDLLDASSITEDTLQVNVGYKPTEPFPVRLIADPNHGSMLGTEYYPTRVIIDPVVSALDAQSSSVPVNSIGFPAAVTTGSANLAIRIPTKEDFEAGQFVLLQNVTGHPLAGFGNKIFDFTSPTLDVVRALRTGGSTEKLGDPSNGFLPDDTQPQVIGRQPIMVTQAINAGSGLWTLNIQFNNALCASAPKVGDVIEQPGIFLEVIADNTVNGAGEVDTLLTRLLNTPTTSPFVGGAHFETPWGLIDKAPAPCFLEFDPPGVTTGSNITNVDPFANIIVRFSEPMDPALINPYDSFTIGNADISLEDMNLGSFQVGEILTSADARDFRFAQAVPYRHIAGNAEDFFVNLNEDEGVVDLAGNQLAISFPTVEFLLEPTAGTQRASGKTFRYQSFFEQEGVGKFIDDDKNGMQDIRGQIVWDLTRGTVSPRSVDRFSATIDRNVFVPGWMTANASTLTGGLLGTAQEPLNPLGCKLMHLWRYFDMGLDVVDEAFVNIDVEHINWAPIGQNVQAEYFPEFRIALASSMALPDESYVTPPNALVFPNSGLVTTSFTENVLLDANNPLTVVHQKERGYFIDPAKKFKSQSGTFMFPYPLNYDKPLADYTYWTFRDTAITTVGGRDPGVGIEQPVRYDTDGATFLGSTEFAFTPEDLTVTPPVEAVAPNLIVTDGTMVPSFGLPILLEFRCYSSDATVGINRLDTSLAMAPVWTAGVGPANALTALPRNPVFRIFSAGGIDSSEQIIYKDPDLQVAPTGGFHYEANTIAPKGAQTGGSDTYFYMGQLDFVVRVSRAHTIWHQIADGSPVYSQPIVEPSADRQPKGTSIQVHMRGATTNGNTQSLNNAATLNMYGDIPVGTGGDVQIFPGSYNANISGLTDWTTDPAAMTGFQFFQVRLTFINNAAAGTSPELSTLALAFLAQ